MNPMTQSYQSYPASMFIPMNPMNMNIGTLKLCEKHKKPLSFYNKYKPEKEPICIDCLTEEAKELNPPNLFLPYSNLEQDYFFQKKSLLQIIDQANNIKKYLELSDFEVLICENGLFWLEVARNNEFDIILLDLMLPWMSGEEICKKIKSEKDIPIIMTTAKWQLEDKLEWFELWADDYLVKPFDLEELEARIKALIRRKQNESKPIKKWNISIDIQNRKILKWDKEVKLTVKEYNILECLVKNIWIPLSRTDIIQEVWGWDSLFDDDWKLDVYISTLRSKLGKDIIETVKWFGYRMNK